MKLGVAGTAKNTGKTTTTATVIKALREREIPFYLTSIGYDGENIDNVTGLPKPKLRLEPGDIVATAEKCLDVSTAGLEVMEATTVSTPLGKIMIAKVLKAGLVVTAGPNKSSEVREIGRILSRLGPGVTIFDGALSRIAPMVETDGFILATGAARTPDIPRLAFETERIWRIANLANVPQSVGLTEAGLSGVSLLDDNLSVMWSWPSSSLLSEADIHQVMERAAGARYLFVPGIIGEKAFSLLAEQASRLPRNLFLTLTDPIKILAAGDPAAYYGWIETLEQARVWVGVTKRVPLLAVTVNPFYPQYRVDKESYEPAFVDFLRLQVSIQNSINVPVYNVMKQGAKGLADIILASAVRWEHPATMQF